MSEFPEFPDTFKIADDGKSITCLHCNMTSYNPNDVKHKYCGKCHIFHEDVWPPARQFWIDEGQKSQEDHPDWRNGESPDRAQLLAWLVMNTAMLEKVRSQVDAMTRAEIDMVLRFGPNSQQIANLD